MQDIKLGSVVRDRITGLQGVAIARTVWRYNVPTLLIQPQELKDSVPVPYSQVDEAQVKVVSTEPVVAPTPPVRKQPPVEMGASVRCLNTGMVGVVTGITTWLTGCTRLAVQPAALHEGGPAALVYLDEVAVAVLTQPTSVGRPPTTSGPCPVPRAR